MEIMRKISELRRFHDDNGSGFEIAYHADSRKWFYQSIDMKALFALDFVSIVDAAYEQCAEMENR